MGIILVKTMGFGDHYKLKNYLSGPNNETICYDYRTIICTPDLTKRKIAIP